MNKTSALLALTASLLLSSCMVLAGAGIGYVVTQEVLPNAAHEAQVRDDVDRVWPSVQETFEILHDPSTEIVVTEGPRRITGRINNADVTIDVEAHDMDRTLIRVTAEKYLAADRSTAEEVMNNVLRRLSN